MNGIKLVTVRYGNINNINYRLIGLTTNNCMSEIEEVVTSNKGLV